MNPLREGLLRQRVPEPCSLVIFGASGDLMKRKLMPAVYSLMHEGLLPPYFTMIGVLRRDYSVEKFRAEMKQAVTQFCRYPINADVWASLEERIDLVQGDFSKQETFDKLKAALDRSDEKFGTKGNRMFYLSTAPSQFAIITELLKKARVTEGAGWNRVVVEKPFGTDFASARDLNSHLHNLFEEEEIYRIDHYLGKETVQNLLVLRFANGIFEPIWKNQNIDHIQITVAETLGVGTRAGYYEESGAVRDMMQNHMMQLLALVAMEPPINLTAQQVRDEKVKVLRALRPIHEKDVPNVTVNAQYTKGILHGEGVKGYREEDNVSQTSVTETYAAVKLFIDNWRWEGVPFYLRHGKRMAKSGTEIAVYFKKAPGILFHAADSETPIEHNALIIRIQPDEGISLRIEEKVPGQNIHIQSVKMDFKFGSEFGGSSPEAYERLILDAMIGDATLFIRHDEAEQSWIFFDPILAFWKKNTDPKYMPTYSAATWGPKEADQLLLKDGYHWRRL
jgi:glucose-6-phosphate 1-dehydrogenase